MLVKFPTFCVSFFCVQVNPIMQMQTTLWYDMDLAYVISRRDYFMSWHNNIRYIVAALTAMLPDTHARNVHVM